MKKFIALVCIAFMLVGCTASAPKEVLRVFNWGSYMDPQLITDFEAEYGVEVVYEEFDSNESMYLKVENDGKYDVLVPTDYMVQRLREEGKLQKLDYSKIPNYEAILSSLKGRGLDPDEAYTVPYFWGNVGIVYDKTKVDSADIEAEGWDIFKDPNYANRVFFLDSERDAFMVALKSLGYSLNSTDPAELEEAYNWLQEMDNATMPIYVRDEMIDNMINGVKDIGLMYSGDASYALASNENLAYYVPEEGTNLWIDAMVIPVDAPNVDLAHTWINFIASQESALRITESVGYTSTRQDVIDIVTEAGGIYEGIESYIIRDDNEKDESYRFDTETRQILADYWQRVKIN